MALVPIPVDEFTLAPHDAFNNRWMLLTAGDFAAGMFNCMTIAWGSFGTMWRKPFAQVVVRLKVRRVYVQFLLDELPEFFFNLFACYVHLTLA